MAAEAPRKQRRGEGGVWFGFFAPAGTAPDQVARLSKALEAAVRSEAFSSKLPIGVIPSFSPPDAFLAEIARDRDIYGRILRDVGIKLN